MASSGTDKALPERAQCATDGCSFFANETTDGLCSQCYKAKCSANLLATEQFVSSAQRCVAEPAAPSADQPEIEADVVSTSTAAAPGGNEEQDPTPPKKKNRCTVCKKKVGLMGFECKCGRMLCPLHRVAEEHGCDYDYRSEGKKRLEEANPRVAFSKVEGF